MNCDYLMLRVGDINCPLHINPELEVVYVESGSVRVDFEKETYIVNGGEAIAILPYHLHKFSYVEGTVATVFMFSFSLAEEIYKNYGTNQFKIQKITLTKPERDYINLCMASKNEEVFRVRSLYYMFVSNFLSNAVKSESNAHSETVSKTVEYIYNHIGESLTLEKVTKSLNINKTTFCKILKDYIGLSFHKFLQNIRIEKAKNLLLTKGKNITEISYECGFGSIRSFNRAFFEQVGCTPTEYRNGKLI